MRVFALFWHFCFWALGNRSCPQGKTQSLADRIGLDCRTRRMIAKIPPRAIKFGCPERYELDNSLILNLGLHDVMHSTIEPNSV